VLPLAGGGEVLATGLGATYHGALVVRPNVLLGDVLQDYLPQFSVVDRFFHPVGLLQRIMLSELPINSSPRGFSIGGTLAI
jgi:hypothetical protein